MEHLIEIQKIIHGGSGLARLNDGMVVMTPFVLPGEKVVVREIKRSRQFALAEPVEIISPSPDRLTPPCPYFLKCGGCNLQHMHYSAQLAVKKSLVEESLARAGLDLTGVHISPTIPSPAPFGYRYRIRLHLDKKGRLGFHRAGERQVIEIDQCLLATGSINRSLRKIKESGLCKKMARFWKSLELMESPSSGDVTLVLHPRSRKATASIPDSLSFAVDHVLIKDTRAYREELFPTQAPSLLQQFRTAGKEYELNWDSHCFFQVNPAMNNDLVELVCKYLETKPKGKLLDLYCGVGNFSIPLGLLGWAVTGIEHNYRSIKWAKRNSDNEAVDNTVFLCRDVVESLAALAIDGERFQAVLLDPPRQGLGKQAAAHTARLGAEVIVYISCDPATLARDLKIMVDQGYQINGVTPVDMFPQTHHIESVVVLEKN